jgi:Transposase and inactivated derivatives
VIGAGVMKRYASVGNREQISLLPMCLDDMIAEDNVVRAIDAIVDNIDIPSLGFTHSETAFTGRKPYNPVDMFKLYIYSYFNGIRSSRKIEKECYRNIEVMWIINELKPDFKTISDFRKDNKKQIKLAFSKFSMICNELGLISKEIVAIDGSKFRANNGRTAYYTKNKLDKMHEHYAESAEKYMSLLDECDEQESDTQNTTLSRAEIEEKIKGIKSRVSELETLADHVKKEGAIYITDPDARIMKCNNDGGLICHNVQIAVEEKTHLIVAVDVTSEPTDYKQFYNMASKAKEELKVDEITAIADKGYYSTDEFIKCKDKGIKAIVSKAKKGNFSSVNYDKVNFKYNAEKDVYICPQGHELSKPTKRWAKSNLIRYQNRPACKDCPVKDLCTTHKHGRTVFRQENEQFADEVDKRTKENMALYNKRKQMAEHPFGTLKRNFGFTYFLTRRTESVRAESFMHFLVYNIKRVINTVGVEKLVEELKG